MWQDQKEEENQKTLNKQKENSKDQPDDGDDNQFSEVLTVGPIINCEKGKHNFILKVGKNAECTKCNVGYYLGIESEVKNGHIYIHGGLVV